jgi:hypothetical protein
LLCNSLLPHQFYTRLPQPHSARAVADTMATPMSIHRRGEVPHTNGRAWRMLLLFLVVRTAAKLFFRAAALGGGKLGCVLHSLSQQVAHHVVLLHGTHNLLQKYKDTWQRRDQVRVDSGSAAQGSTSLSQAVAAPTVVFFVAKCWSMEKDHTIGALPTGHTQCAISHRHHAPGDCEGNLGGSSNDALAQSKGRPRGVRQAPSQIGPTIHT